MANETADEGGRAFTGRRRRLAWTDALGAVSTVAKHALGRLKDAAGALLASRPLTDSLVSAFTGRASLVLPPIRLEERVADLGLPDEGFADLLDRLPTTARPGLGRVVVMTAVEAEPVARMALKLGRLAQDRIGDAIVVDAKIFASQDGAKQAGAGEGEPGRELGSRVDQALNQGLATHLLGLAPLGELIRPTRAGGLSILTAGRTTLPASSLLSGARWHRAVLALRRRFPTIVVIAPPVGADSFADIARRADGIVLLADRHVTPDFLGDRVDLVTKLAPRAAVLIGLVESRPTAA